MPGRIWRCCRMLGKKLGDEDLAQLRIANHLARRYQNAISGNARRQPDVAAKLGIKSAGPAPPQIAIFCNRDLSQIRL